MVPVYSGLETYSGDGSPYQIVVGSLTEGFGGDSPSLASHFGRRRGCSDSETTFECVAPYNDHLYLVQ